MTIIIQAARGILKLRPLKNQNYQNGQGSKYSWMFSLINRNETEVARSHLTSAGFQRFQSFSITIMNLDDICFLIFCVWLPKDITGQYDEQFSDIT